LENKVCWNCGAALPEFEWGKVSFRAYCEKCNADLHCCKNCVNYCPGKPNDCLIPLTEYVADREKNNHCDSFKLLGSKGPKGPTIEDIEKKLFGG
jgi:hypothetical protein